MYKKDSTRDWYSLLLPAEGGLSSETVSCPWYDPGERTRIYVNPMSMKTIKTVIGERKKDLPRYLVNLLPRSM